MRTKIQNHALCYRKERKKKGRKEGRKEEGGKEEKVRGVNPKRTRSWVPEDKSWRDLGRSSSLKVIVGVRLNSESR